MRNKTKTRCFEAKVIAFVIAIPLIPTIFAVGCSHFNRPEVRYYKIQRLNLNGDVQQVYYSESYPWGTDGYVSFIDYPSKKHVKMHTPYVAEDIGTNKPTLQ